MSISITGLASGLDTASMISKLMEIERYPYNRLETKKSYLKSEQSVFRSINTKLSALQTAIADLKLSSTYHLSSAKSADDTVVKATASEGASTGSFNIQITQLAKSHTIASNIVDENSVNLVGKEFFVKGNKIDMSGLDADANNGDVLEYVKNQINQNNWGISATVMSVDDSGNKVLSLISKETGAESKIVKVSDPSDPVGSKEISISGSGFDELTFTQKQAAQNAIFTVNGIDVEKSSNSVKDVISGVTLELLKEGSSSTVTVASDGDKVASKIDAFVKAYNDVVTTVRDNLAKPADETKMNPLQGDALLKDISNSLYQMFTGASGELGEGFRMMSELGLTIDKGITKGSEMTGRITFDKELFKQKLAENPNAVADLFKDSDSGIIAKMDERLKEWTRSSTGLLATKISGYDSEIKMVDDRMVAMDVRLTMKEQQLKNQFNAMEVALSKLKSEQSWLTAQFAALSSLNSGNKK
jgi:Flagellar capping protein